MTNLYIQGIYLTHSLAHKKKKEKKKKKDSIKRNPKIYSIVKPITVVPTL